MNCCSFEGNVGKDPEFKTTPNGTPIANFSVCASKPDYKNKDQWINTWINVKVIGKNHT